MISLDKAKELREVGLKWEPTNGDFFATDQSFPNIFVISGSHDLHETLGGKMWFFNGHLCSRDGGCQLNETASDCMQADARTMPKDFNIYHISSFNEFIWLPRLDQLLAEIERNGHEYGLQKAENKYTLFLYPKSQGNCFSCIENFDADTTEDAAADALLRILQFKGRE